MIVGIDLGTTNSLVAVYRNGRSEVIPNRLGKFLTPSIISVDESGEILVGELAREYGYLHPESTAKVFKRTMGTDKEYVLNGMKFLSEELSSFVLRSLKEDAEVYLNETVEEAIISVPAYFNDNQRKATKRAGELAGLNVSRIISEPTASAIAYGVTDNNMMERCLVFDLGGGTFDVSILEYFRKIMEVHAIAGDNYLGGEDFTNVLMDIFAIKNGFPLALLDYQSYSSLYKACEKAKCEIRENESIAVKAVISGEILEAEIAYEEYEKGLEPLLERLKAPLEKSLRDAKITYNDIDRIILVGGATKMKIVRDYVFKLTGIRPDFTVDPDKSVVIGAALQCAMKTRDESIEEMILTDVCPFTLGTEVVRDNGIFVESGHYLPIIERNTVIPVSKKQRLYTAYEQQDEVRVKVLQGESRLASNNIYLGEITVPVPKGPKGKESIDITYTYDVNSILEVEVVVTSTNEYKKIIILNEKSNISEAEAEERLKRLQYLKQNPREDEANKLVMARGERLYEENSGSVKDEIDQLLFEFEQILNKDDRMEIEHFRKKMNERFDELESPVPSKFFS